MKIEFDLEVYHLEVEIKNFKLESKDTCDLGRALDKFVESIKGIHDQLYKKPKQDVK